MMKIDWRDALRHLLQVLAFCSVVAVFTTMIWAGSGYPHQLVYSLCIGLTTWGVIEFGRYLVDPRHCHRAAGAASQGWPKVKLHTASSASGVKICPVSVVCCWSSAATSEALKSPNRKDLALMLKALPPVIAVFSELA